MANPAFLADTLSAFVKEQRFDDIPSDVRTRGKLLILDALGAAFASSDRDFSNSALAGLKRFGPGDFDVIGTTDKLSLRDSVLMNGILIHGLDFDDTYLPGSMHLTASCVPAAFGMAVFCDASGKEALTSCLIGLEIAARLAAAGKGGFLKAGFHATGIVGAFSSTLIAARLMGLSASQMTMAQGISLSTAAGNLQTVQEGAWTKRMHPGWAVVGGITGALLAAEGFNGPQQVYEGHFGLFPSFLREHAKDADASLATSELGRKWSFVNASIKLYPACHQSHAFMNAAIKLCKDHNIDPAEIESIKTLIAQPAIELICEPAAKRAQPTSSYAAQFSLPYAMACCFIRRKFGLEEIEESSYTDPKLLSLARKVSYQIDPNSGFPKTRTGEVIVTLKNGQKFSRREEINPNELPSADAITGKFRDMARSKLSEKQANEVVDMIMNLENITSVKALTKMLTGAQGGA